MESNPEWKSRRVHTSMSVVVSVSFFPRSLFRHSSLLISGELEVESALAWVVLVIPGTMRGMFEVDSDETAFPWEEQRRMSSAVRAGVGVEGECYLSDAAKVSNDAGTRILTGRTWVLSVSTKKCIHHLRRMLLAHPPCVSSSFLGFTKGTLFCTIYTKFAWLSCVPQTSEMSLDKINIRFIWKHHTATMILKCNN